MRRPNSYWHSNGPRWVLRMCAVCSRTVQTRIRKIIFIYNRINGGRQFSLFHFFFSSILFASHCPWNRRLRIVYSSLHIVMVIGESKTKWSSVHLNSVIYWFFRSALSHNTLHHYRWTWEALSDCCCKSECCLEFGLRMNCKRWARRMHVSPKKILEFD